MRKNWRVSTVLCVALLVASPALASASGWVSPAATLSAESGVQAVPKVASNARGDTAVAWLDPATNHVFVSERPVGGAFTLGSEVSNIADQVLGSIAIDGSGTIYVFFMTENSNTAASRPRVATKAIGAASWLVTPLAAANSADPPQSSIQGAVNPDGSALAVWFQGHTAGAQLSKMEFARKAAGSALWGVKADIPGISGNTFQHTLVMNGRGDAALTYSKVVCTGLVPHAFGTTMTGATGVWSTANQITSCNGVVDNPVVSSPSVAIDETGTATATWSHVNANHIVQFSTKTLAAASWPVAPVSGAANDLSPAGSDADTPTVTVSPDGTTTIAFSRNGTIETRTRPAIGGAFAATSPVPTTLTSANNPVLRSAPDGATVVVFSGSDATPKFRVGAARRAPGATAFTALPDAPGTDNGLPAAAIDDEGNVAAAWVHANTGPLFSVAASGLDLAGPAISNVTYPATGAQLTAFTYGATLTDRWSAPSGTWAFGDGTSGPLSGSKTYLTPGAFTATLTATDALGNATTTSRGITITDTTTPLVTLVSLSKKTFAINPKGPAEKVATALAPKGTVIRYTLSEAARVVFTVERATEGRKVGGTCVARTKANAKRTKCTRYVRVSSFAKASAVGKNTKSFSGRIGKKTLAPGRYRLNLVATDASGNRSKPARVLFTIVLK